MVHILVAFAALQPFSPDVKLIPLDQVRIQEFKRVQDIRDRILAANPYAGYEPADLMLDPAVREMGISAPEEKSVMDQALHYRFDKGVLKDLQPVDFSGNDPMFDYSVPRTDASGVPLFETFKQGYKDKPLAIYMVKITETSMLNSKSTAPAAPPQSIEVYSGILVKEDLERTLKAKEAEALKSGSKVTTEIEDSTEVPVHLYENSHKQIVAVLDKPPAEPLHFPDRPEFVLVKAAPSQAQDAFKSGKIGGLGLEEVSWAVKEPDGIVDFEHVRRQAFLDIQKLRDDVLAKHPTNAQFPPEMLSTPEFQATGLKPAQSQNDQVLFYQALNFHPEGQVLNGFHPIDFATDKAATYSAIAPSDGSNHSDITVETLRDMFEGKKVFLFKLHLEAKDPAAGQSTSVYYGPATPETMDALKKSKADMKISYDKSEAVPLSIYTDTGGDVEFVMASKPKDVLLVQVPTLIVSGQPVDEVKADTADPKAAEKIVRKTVGYAVLSQ